jgi:hypothetical protein
VAQVVEHLPSKCETLSSNPSTTNDDDDDDKNEKEKQHNYMRGKGKGKKKKRKSSNHGNLTVFSAWGSCWLLGNSRGHWGVLPSTWVGH